MIIDIAAILQVLPEFAGAGILSIVFYMEFKGPLSGLIKAPEFILVRGDSIIPMAAVPVVSGSQSSSPRYSEVTAAGEDSMALASFKDIQLILATVSLWIILALALLPQNRLKAILPNIPFNYQIIAYGILAVLFLISLTSTVVLHIRSTRMHVAIILAAGAAIAYLAFYLPSMQWIAHYALILRAIIIYCSVAATAFGLYAISSIMGKSAVVKLAIVGTFALYAFTAALLLTNLIQLAF